MSSTSIVWKDKAEETSFGPLRNDITVDVAIVGGGITGLTAAYILSQAGKSVAVLEARNIGGGATGSSTGNLYCTIGSPGLHSVKSKFSRERITDVVESRAAAVSFIEARVKEFNIDCDFKRVPWSLFTEHPDGESLVEKEKKAALDAGLNITENFAPSFNVTKGFTVENQAQFNPLQYVVSFAKNISSKTCSIYELTTVTDVKEGDVCTVATAGGTVTANQVIMATHSPKGIYAVHMNMGPYREYAVAVKLNGEYPPPGIWWNQQSPTEHYSMRTYETSQGQVLMALGESHKVGQKEHNHECFDVLEKFLREKFDVASVEYNWSAQQFKPSDGLPYIGLSTGNSKTYIATGFSADGLIYGTLASMIISDQILGKENKWNDTYKASRITPIASAPKFVKENINVAFEFIKDHLASNKGEFSEVATGTAKVLEFDGHKYGVYRDENDKLHVVSAVCTHMGCINHWNEVEKSWDCPCHGSRFSIDGAVIEGPAYEALSKLIV